MADPADQTCTRDLECPFLSDARRAGACTAHGQRPCALASLTAHALVVEAVLSARRTRTDTTTDYDQVEPLQRSSVTNRCGRIDTTVPIAISGDLITGEPERTDRSCAENKRRRGHAKDRTHGEMGHVCVVLLESHDAVCPVNIHLDRVFRSV